MGWPIAQLSAHRSIKPISYLLWGFILLGCLAIGVILTLIFYRDPDYSFFWFYAIIIPIVVWLIGIGFSITKYFYALTLQEELEKQNQQIKQAWQKWSQQQLPVVAHYFICAEEDALFALTHDISKIPLFPEKARPLFNSGLHTKSFWFLDEVMNNLQKQYPNYRQYLARIYLPDNLLDDDKLVDEIYLRWDLIPEPIGDYAVFMSQCFENPDEIELSLLLTCQYNEKIYRKNSKFISAMMICSEPFLTKSKLDAQTWLGRLMVSNIDTLADDFHQLFEYMQISPDKLHDIWLSGQTQQTKTLLAIESYQLGIGLNDEHQFHLVDLSFAKPTNLTSYFVHALASCYAKHAHFPQLTINQFGDEVHLQFITPKKLMS